jgi:small-conductance mechanosensitive channel
MTVPDRIRNSGLADPSTLQGACLLAVVFAFVAWLIGGALRLAVQRLLAHDTHARVDLMAVRFLGKLARYCVYLVAFVAYAHLVPALADLGSASLTSISVITVIVGLAAQNTLGNLVAGISLLLYRPFKLGDRLQVVAPTGLEAGVVESLTLGYTLLRTDDNRRVVVPNSLMASQTAINLTTNDPRVVCSVPVAISGDADLDKARAILLELGRLHPMATRVCGCPVTAWSAAGVVLSLDLWCPDALTAIGLRCELLEQAKKRFANEGIALSVQQSIVRVKDGRIDS